MDQENRGLKITAWVWMIAALVAFFVGAYQIYAKGTPQGGRKNDSASVSYAASCSSVGQIVWPSPFNCVAPGATVVKCYRNNSTGQFYTTGVYHSCSGTPAPTDPNLPNPPTTGSTSTCTPIAPQGIQAISPMVDVVIEADGGFTLNWKALKSLGRTCNGVNLRETLAISAVEKTATMNCTTVSAKFLKPVASGRFANTGFISSAATKLGYRAQITKTAGTLTDAGKFIYSSQFDKNTAAAATTFKFEAGKTYCIAMTRGNGQSSRVIRASLQFKS